MAAGKDTAAPYGRELVFEIGCEELPAGSLKPALEWMEAEMNRALDDARLNGEGEGQRANISGYATPRRLALVVTAIAERAPDVKKTVQGPPAKAAFQEGKPTKAAEGFARKIGVPVSALRVEGDRVVVEQEIRGQSAAEALPGILERLVRGIPFKKSMRWDSLDKDAFARPVHWIAAMLDGKPLPVAFADVKSGSTTRGHRFAAPKPFPVPPAKKYVAELRAAHVLADWAERKQRIWEEVQRAAKEARGEPLPDEDLLETVTGLVEEPFAVVGHFEESFLELPPEVLVSEMRGHQKYFSVRDPRTQRLLPAFVAVSNTRVADPSVSRRGYERVLRARLSDGRFFYDEDRKVKLAARIERLARRTFMDKLGTELERVERLRELSLWLHGVTGKGEPAVLRRAAELCKTDLTTGMVGEFPELQGFMGRYYALHDGEPREVADAIEAHYRPRFAGDHLPDGMISCSVAVADKLDALAGLFGIGQAPTGERDPFGLRRAALGVVRILVERGLELSLFELVKREDVASFIFERARGYFQERGYSAVEVDSVLSLRPARLDLVPRQLQAVRAFSAMPEAESLAAANKRIGNILKQAETVPPGFDIALMVLPEEKALASTFKLLQPAVDGALRSLDYTAALKQLASLKAPVDAFFDKVMVMDKDPRVRANRIGFLGTLHGTMNRIADLSKLAK